MQCEMRFDEEGANSRDSGFGDDAELADMPIDFQFTAPKALDMEMDELVLSENTSFSSSEQRALKALAKPRGGLADITNSPRLFNSPKARVSRKFGRCLSNLPGTISRKRSSQDAGNAFKKPRAESIDENSELQPSCSSLFPALLPVHLARVHSSSQLECGRFSHNRHADVNDFKEISYSLPTVSSNIDSQAYRRIDATTLVRLMNSMTEAEFRRRFFLVDCRYPYEYDGGHVKYAMNIFDADRVGELVFANPAAQGRIPIFYCEFSQKRGPAMANSLRGFDRNHHRLQYPKVAFEEMYVVDGGYKGFWNHVRIGADVKLCSPAGYTDMIAPAFTDELKKYNFHKRSSVSATCARPPVEPRQRMFFRQQSLESPTGRSVSRKLSFPTGPSTPVQTLRPVPNPSFS